MNLAEILHVSVTPVVLISASGLVALALYNRLGLINARVRNFHREKISLLKELRADDDVDKRLLLNMMNSQIARVMHKATLMVWSLYGVLLGIVAFVLCSLLAALGTMWPTVSYAAFALHLAGLCLFLAGVLMALWELTRSLTPMAEENAYLEFYSVCIDGSRPAEDQPPRG